MKTFITVITVLLGFGLFGQNLNLNNQLENIVKDIDNQFFNINSERYSYNYFDGIVTVDQYTNEPLGYKELEFTMNEYIYTDASFSFENLKVTPAIRFDYFRDSSASSFFIDSRLTSNINTIAKLDALYTISEGFNFSMQSAVGFQNRYIGIEQIGKMHHSYAIDIGLEWNPFYNVSLQTTFWMFNMDQGFVYVDEEGLVEANGKEQRVGVDMSITYHINDWLFFNSDFFYANADNNNENMNYELAAEGGLNINGIKNFSGGIGCRYANTGAIEDTKANTSYLATDMNIEYSKNEFTFGIAIENIFNINWGEPELAMASRLTDRLTPVNGSYFVPDDGVFIQAGISYSF
ncbi:hypothetical protein [uncultured Aquimarina sp.]|uniref:hypothetical protein n=1 Tax=uncultured Aquimarina sp. TaxID=575652 RepID=UPI0026047983|nr:hypothetical protein [uncultured Aquimarina sp.]